MLKKYVIIVFCILIVGILIVLLRTTSTSQESSQKLSITTSFYPLYYFTSQIGGTKVSVHNITPAGSEPHDYDPTARDMARIESGNMLILNGGVEAWADKVQENLKGTKVKILVAGEGLLTQKLTDSGKTRADFHIWLDPILAKQESENIAKGLSEIDPVNSQYYMENEKLLAKKLDALDMKLRESLTTCLSRDIVTSHAAFGYLASRYGLNQIPISGLSPDAEPSTKELASIATYAREHKIRYIFFEQLVSPKLSETIAREVGAKTLVLDPIEGISDDDIKLGKNYFTIMESNLVTLKEALECK